MSRSTCAGTNQSSGKMGYAVARRAGSRCAGDAGIGVTALAAPAGVERVDVVTAREMHKAVMARGSRPMSSSRSPQSPITIRSIPSLHKIKRGNGNLNVSSRRTLTFSVEVAALPKGPFCVGFAA